MTILELHDKAVNALHAKQYERARVLQNERLRKLELFGLLEPKNVTIVKSAFPYPTHMILCRDCGIELERPTSVYSTMCFTCREKQNRIYQKYYAKKYDRNRRRTSNSRKPRDNSSTS